jgi:hypothetical protein
MEAEALTEDLLIAWHDTFRFLIQTKRYSLRADRLDDAADDFS